MENTQDTSQVKATAKQLGINLTFFVIYLACLSAFGSFVNDMYLPSLPSMVKYFGCSIPMVQMGLTTGMIGLALGELLMGPISDRYGRKPVLYFSLTAFVISAVVSIFSPTIAFFLVLRLFQGVGASGGYFLARTIPADIFMGRELAKIMAIVGAINGFAPASAPVIGGVISQYFEWKGVFVVLAIFAATLLCIAPRLKESLPVARRTSNLKSAFSNYIVLLKNRKFIIHTILKGTALGVLFAYISSAPFIIETHYGYSQTIFGLIMGANAVMVAAGSIVALRFKQLRYASLTGAISLMVFVLIESGFLLFSNSFIGYELSLLPILFSLGMIFTVSNTMAMNEGRMHAGDASAFLGIIGYVFGATVSPIVGEGDILHTSAYVFTAITVMVLVVAVISFRVNKE